MKILKSSDRPLPIIHYLQQGEKVTLAEGVQDIAFIVLAALMIMAALGVVLFEKIVYSAFLLALVFISISGLYVLLNADFVAAAQILIYVGAVNVLILFAIMLVNKREIYTPLKNRWLRQGATAVVCGGLFLLLGTMVVATPWAIDETVVTGSTVIAIGKHFFSDFLLPFELASVLLLMAMVGAIILARRDFIPTVSKTSKQPQGDLKLPERPREVAAIAGNSPKN
nr:NADH-quinone oxidoreductase subunit J [Spirulina major]